MTTTNNAELALCAARTRMLGEQLNDVERDKLIVAWGELLDEIANPRVSSDLAIAEFRARIEERLTAARSPAPT